MFFAVNLYRKFMLWLIFSLTPRLRMKIEGIKSRQLIDIKLVIRTMHYFIRQRKDVMSGTMICDYASGNKQEKRLLADEKPESKWHRYGV